MTRRLTWGIATGVAVAVIGAIVRRTLTRAARAHEEARVDEALADSFPASDPPAY